MSIKNIYIHIYIFMYVYLCIYIYLYVCMNIYIYISIYLYIYIYIYMNVFIYLCVSARFVLSFWQYISLPDLVLLGIMGIYTEDRSTVELLWELLLLLQLFYSRRTQRWHCVGFCRNCRVHAISVHANRFHKEHVPFIAVLEDSRI